MHAFCCNDTLPVKTATYILHTVCILPLSLILDISGSVWGAFGVRSGSFRRAFGVRSHTCITRGGIYLPGHITGVLTMFWVTLHVYLRGTVRRDLNIEQKWIIEKRLTRVNTFIIIERNDSYKLDLFPEHINLNLQKLTVHLAEKKSIESINQTIFPIKVTNNIPTL